MKTAATPGLAPNGNHPNQINRTNDTLLVIGYGSLLSGYGLLAERRGGSSKLLARDAFAVRLHNAQRGFAKPSSHGHYLAMDLEPVRRGEPIVAHAGVDGTDKIGGGGIVREALPVGMKNTGVDFKP